MLNESVIFDSTVAGWGEAATWRSYAIDTMNPASKTVSFHIWWEDVGITFYLYKSNYFAAPLTAPYEDFTAAYRAIDPGWVDPVLGDPANSNHIVSFINIGAKYVKIGYSASNWGGAPANRKLRINLVVERYPG